jgi:uncharacterized RDD family membrane protein YckC
VAKRQPFDVLPDWKYEPVKSRFELDRANGDQAPGKRAGPESLNPESVHSQSTRRQYVDPESVNPESYDASERHFAMSLDKSVNRRFVVEEQHPDGDGSEAIQGGCEGTPLVAEEVASATNRGIGIARSQQRDFLEFSSTPEPQVDTESTWRQEVSASLTKYQARRRLRTPRYPSLQFKFETWETARGSSPAEDMASASVPGSSALATTLAADAVRREVFRPPLPPPYVEPTSRVIEFPRSSTAPPSYSEELAEPVFDRPRIMEAPELVPAPPALGGILIEPEEAPANEKRPGFEMPLQAASMARRLAATVIDALIVFAGLGLFGYIFWRVTTLIPSMRAAAPILVIVGVTLWAAYQYLLVVHCVATPGLRLAKLRLSHFDGTAVPQKMRRWRVLASVLSGLSLGLGYAWCFLDEDQLCWHDRITRTYMAPGASAK